MQPFFARFLAIGLLMSTAAFGQSLGDVARENREKKAADDNSANPPKVITNKDLKKDAAEDHDSPEANPANQNSADQIATHRSLERSARQRLAEQRAATQWQRQILVQKNRVTVLQAKVDELNAEIQSSFGSVQYEAPYSRPHARQLRRISQMQQQLDGQKLKLADMQEAARRAGMHTATYDP